ncbi:MAG: DUF3293 domain-containing protein [Myxococcota bacterium]|nr:DUF3293 domain-containing protein [Myxococcota bacterium]
MMWSEEKYNRAMSFAAQKHKKQYMPSSDVPYLLHLTMVSGRAMVGALQTPGTDVELVMQAAILHDVLEDTDCLPQEVEAVFGTEVLRGVESLSKRVKIGERRLSKREQMEDSLVRILQQPKEIALVKLADRITNLGIPPVSWFYRDRKMESYVSEAQLILDALGGASPYLATILAGKIQAYAQFFQKREYPIIRTEKDIQTHLWQTVRLRGRYEDSLIHLPTGKISVLGAIRSELEGKSVFAYGIARPQSTIEPLVLVERQPNLPIEEAYVRTTYCVEGIGVHIHRRHPSLDALVKKYGSHTWTVITASNPLGKEKTETENARMNEQLEKELLSKHLRFFRSVGMPHTEEWAPEQSFCILGLSREEAERMGEKYRQNAIVFGRIHAKAELVFTRLSLTAKDT